MAVGCVWFNSPPRFKTRGLTAEDTKRNLLTSVVVTSKTPKLALAAAVHRALEKLYIKQYITNPAYGAPPVRVLVNRKHKNAKLAIPLRVVDKHWLLTGSKRILDELCEV